MLHALFAAALVLSSSRPPSAPSGSPRASTRPASAIATAPSRR